MFLRCCSKSLLETIARQAWQATVSIVVRRKKSGSVDHVSVGCELTARFLAGCGSTIFNACESSMLQPTNVAD
jgi:hypothetical protein